MNIKKSEAKLETKQSIETEKLLIFTELKIHLLSSQNQVNDRSFIHISRCYL